jgi:fatty-acyl-CoA synthase
LICVSFLLLFLHLVDTNTVCCNLSPHSEGFLYFVDRVGDTFRWKGENVATGEVGAIVSAVAGVREANVYGVAVPRCEGRAGMACIVADGARGSTALRDILAGVFTESARHLPGYARPLFVRIAGEIQITGTFKHRKVDLVAEGFNPVKVADPVYFRDEAKGKYVRMTTKIYEEIASGKIRV